MCHLFHALQHAHPRHSISSGILSDTAIDHSGGIDVGSGRPNLVFLTRVLENIKNPVLDILNILPEVLDTNTQREAIDKSLFYSDSEEAYCLAVQTLRKVLPEHLRDCVQPFSSDGSKAAKTSCWEGFMSGRIHILCATDATGMGCNVPDVRYSVIFGCPKSLSVIAQ
jgi:superfamily II DNA helicase RecQ